MTITRIKTVYVVSDDVERCAGFYEAVLGVPVRFRDGDRWVQFASEGAGFAVASREEAGGTQQATVAVFAATEPQDHDRMMAAGAALVETRNMGDHGTSRSYRDPVGNLIQVLWK